MSKGNKVIDWQANLQLAAASVPIAPNRRFRNTVNEPYD